MSGHTAAPRISRTTRRIRVLLGTALAVLVAISFNVVPASLVALAGLSSGACAFADSETATECVISAAWTVGGGGVGANNFPAALPGPFAFQKDLHITGTGAIDAIGSAGITVTIDGTSGGTGALIMDNARIKMA